MDDSVLAGHLRIVEMIAAGAPSKETLDVLLKTVEKQYPEMMCSVLLVDEQGCVRSCSAPSLPKEYSEEISGQPIGPRAGSCGTAAFRREPVFASDIATDSLWEDYRQVALRYGLRACWSMPILDPQQSVLGTFAIYYRTSRLPEADHVKLIESAARYAAIILNRYQTELALRESEERFRQLVEAIGVVFWMADASRTKILYVSPGYEKIWGRSRESLHQSPGDWLNAVHPDDRERIRMATAQPPECQSHEEYRIVLTNGCVRWIRDSAFPIRDAQGRVYRIAGVAEDITERRHLEEQLRQSQKLDAVGALSAGIAHDFNNILGVIDGNAELALQDVGQVHPATESIRALIAATQRARELVQQILAFSRSGQHEKKVIVLDPLINETLKLLRALLPANVHLSAHVSENTPKVMANATQVQQVLINVCTNAWHAIEDRRGAVSIDLSPVVIEAEFARKHNDLQIGQIYACLSVSDTGRGMDTATLKRAFEPFFTTRPPGKGTGLGLSMAHGIMKSHGGSIVIESEPGRGTTVFLYFPAASSPAEMMAPPAEPAPSGTGQRIMYIDDEVALADVTVRVLKRMGYAAEGFTNAEAAVDAFRANPARIDLVVTDLNMPGMSGLDVSRELLAIRADLPIVLTTGFINDGLMEEARRIGVKQVLYKANTVQELCESVHNALQGHNGTLAASSVDYAP